METGKVITNKASRMKLVVASRLCLEQLIALQLSTKDSSGWIHEVNKVVVY